MRRTEKLERLVTSLREAFQRNRYGGDADYNPDFDLFDAAADAIEGEFDKTSAVTSNGDAI